MIKKFMMAFAAILITGMMGAPSAGAQLLLPLASEDDGFDELNLEYDISTGSDLWTLFHNPVDLWWLDMESLYEDSITPNLADELSQFASQFLGRRYLLGATGPKAFDCSGFTRHVFRNAGIELQRTSRAQYAQGEAISNDELQPGDLMFFSTPRSGRGRVGHVAMVVEVADDKTLTFIHASTSKGVTYQKFPDHGYFSRHYIGAKRVLRA